MNGKCMLLVNSGRSGLCLARLAAAVVGGRCDRLDEALRVTENAHSLRLTHCQAEVAVVGGDRKDAIVDKAHIMRDLHVRIDLVYFASDDVLFMED